MTLLWQQLTFLGLKDGVNMTGGIAGTGGKNKTMYTAYINCQLAPSLWSNTHTWNLELYQSIRNHRTENFHRPEIFAVFEVGPITRKHYLWNNHCYTSHVASIHENYIHKLFRCNDASVNIFNCQNFPCYGMWTFSLTDRKLMKYCTCT